MFAKGQFVCRREGFTRRNDVWLPAVKNVPNVTSLFDRFPDLVLYMSGQLVMPSVPETPLARA